MNRDEKQIQLRKIALMRETLEMLRKMEEHLRKMEERSRLGNTKKKYRILGSWKGKLVEVQLRGSETIELARLEDFDESGVYLTTDEVEKRECETLIDEGYYPWRKVKIIRPFKEVER